MSSEPIGVSGIAGRYATALFDLADDQKDLDRVADDLANLREQIAGSDDLRRMIQSPVISREDQQRAIDAIMDLLNVSDLTRRFVGLVSRNGRLFALDDMARAYRGILADRRGEITAEVTSATPLSDAQKDRLAEQLHAGVAGKVQIEAKVDPEILGGLIVRIGSRMIDSSLRTKLQKLQIVLKGAA